MEPAASNQSSHKDAAVSFLRLVVEGKIREAYTAYVDPGMRHHNVYFPGDAASLERGMEENQALFPHKVFDVKQALEDVDRVAVHSRIRMDPEDRGHAVVHIFRFAGDRIVEMWDIIQPVPEDSPNENGMF